VGALQRVMNNVSGFFAKLTPAQKLMLGSVAVIGLLAWLVVAQYSSRGATVTLPVGGSPEEVGQRVAVLQAAGIDAQITPMGITVPKARQQEAMSKLGEAKLLPADSQYLFRNLIEGQTWWASREQNKRDYLLALRGELSRQIGQYAGIRSATVNLDVPEVQGLGAPSRRPTASVTLRTADGGAVSQGTVDAVAAHVAGAVAGLDLDRVHVIDATTGRSRKPSTGSEVISTTYLEHASRVEQQTWEKLSKLLENIPGVSIAVTAEVDVTQVTARVQTNMDKGQGTVSLPKRSTSQSTTQSNRAQGAEPGLRSNAGADIARAGGNGSSLEESEEENEFDNHVGSRTESIIDPRGMPTRLAVSVNVPRGYVSALITKEKAEGQPKDAAPADATPPTEDEITQRFEAEKSRIVTSLTPHVQTRDSKGAVTSGEVVVSMVSMDMPQLAGMDGGGLLGTIGIGGGSSGGGGLLNLGGGMIDTIVLGVLALVALFMMLSMVKKSAKSLELPTAEELVGVPPQVELKGEAIGEAAEGEMAMSGIEIDDGEMRMAKMLESVNEMVQQDPSSAANALNRWVQLDA
jgi:flagellar biosynthesis/type III secretory pathway M-ring protein FliF/YscJ